jgi:hypothetical protein
LSKQIWYVMINIQFEANDSDQLYNYFLKGEHYKTRLKSLALYFKFLGLPHSQIIKFCRISEPTLASYLNDFNANGFDSLQTLKWKGQKSELNDFVDQIDADFSAMPPKTATEAKERIFKLTGINRSPTQIRIFMKDKLNYRFLKTGSLPGNGKDDDIHKEQERDAFKKNALNHCWTKPKRMKK